VLIDEALSAGRPDVAQGGQIGDLPRTVGRIERQRPARLQLPPVARVRLPVAADFSAVAGVQVGDRTDQRKALTRLGVLDLQHRVAVVFGAEDDPQHLDGAAEGSGIGIEEGRSVAHRAKLPPPREGALLGNPKYDKMPAIRPNRGRTKAGGRSR
jgi:hypothetical protein